MKKIIIILCLTLVLGFSSVAGAKESKPQPQSTKTPDSVIDISKENTYPNPSHDEPELQPSSLTKKLLKTSKTGIENKTLIKLLNESTLHTTRLSIGYYARIYLGEWPLNYTSNKTAINWEYKKINDNPADTRGSEGGLELSYVQKSQAKVSGGLTDKVPSQKEVQKMIMAKAMKKTHLPISFSTIIGNGTKLDRLYQVAPKQVAHLYGYVPAVNEKGKVTYGEVYLVLKGNKKYLDVKNIVQQGIGAWIPIQDHVSLRYIAK